MLPLDGNTCLHVYLYLDNYLVLCGGPSRHNERRGREEDILGKRDTIPGLQITEVNSLGSYENDGTGYNTISSSPRR